MLTSMVVIHLCLQYHNVINLSQHFYMSVRLGYTITNDPSIADDVRYRYMLVGAGIRAMQPTFSVLPYTKARSEATFPRFMPNARCHSDFRTQKAKIWQYACEQFIHTIVKR